METVGTRKQFYYFGNPVFHPLQFCTTNHISANLYFFLFKTRKRYPMRVPLMVVNADFKLLLHIRLASILSFMGCYVPHSLHQVQNYDQNYTEYWENMNRWFLTFLGHKAGQVFSRFRYGIPLLTFLKHAHSESSACGDRHVRLTASGAGQFLSGVIARRKRIWGNLKWFKHSNSGEDAVLGKLSQT